MSPQAKLRNPWRLSSRPLIAAAAMGVAAAALTGGASWFAKTIALEQGQAQARLLAAKEALQKTQADRARLEENLPRFDQLKQARFTQVPDRLLMLETLENAAKALHPSALEWELGPQENLKKLNDDKTGGGVAQLVRVPMKLTVSGVHEEEWLALLGRLQNSGAGYFTADSCVYERQIFTHAKTSVPAVNVLCNLSWLYVLADGATPKTP